MPKKAKSKPEVKEPSSLYRSGATKRGRSSITRPSTSTRRKQPARNDGVKAAPGPPDCYSGKITTTGSSEAIRIDKQLFKSHPEFKQHASVTVQVIAPGRILVTVNQPKLKKHNGEHYDAVLDHFLGFIEQDMQKNPSEITPLDEALIAEAEALTAGVVFDNDNDDDDDDDDDDE